MPSSWFEPLQARASYQSEAVSESRAGLAEAAALACSRAAPALLARQYPEGYWVGDLLADSTLESDYVLLQLWLHPPRDGEWKPLRGSGSSARVGRSSTGSGATAASTSIRTGPPTSTRRSRRTWPSGSRGSRPRASRCGGRATPSSGWAVSRRPTATSAST